MRPFFLSIFLVLPFILVLVSHRYYVPGSDEGFQIQGAIQLSQGKGYYSGRDLVPDDLSQPLWPYVNAWPIGYSYVISKFINLGMSPGQAAKTFVILILLAGLFFWNFLASKVLKPPRTWIFSIFISVQALTWANYSTNLLSWTVMPLLTLLLLKEAEKPKTFKYILGASTLAALLILFRYQNVSVPVAGILLLLFFYRKDWKSCVAKSLVFGSLPLLCFLAISIVNRLHRGEVYSFLPQPSLENFRFKLVWLIQTFEAFYLESSFKIMFVAKKLFHSWAAEKWGTWVTGTLAFLIFSANIYLFRKIWKKDSTIRPLMIWFFCSLGVIVLMFFAVGILMNNPLHFLGRYYHFIFPLLILVALTALKVPKKLEKTLLIGFAALAFLVSVLYARQRSILTNEFYEKASSVAAKMDQVEKLEGMLPEFVVVDHLYGMFVAYRPETYYLYTDFFDSVKVHFSSPTYVYLITDNNPKNWQFDSLERVKEIATKFGFKHDPLGEIDFYWKKFSPGLLKDQHE